MNAIQADKKKRFSRVIFIPVILLVASMPVSIAGMHISLSLCILLALWDWWSRPPIGWRKTPLDEPIIIFIVISFLSALFGLNPGKSLIRLGVVWIFLVYYLLLWYASSENQMKKLINILCLVAGIVSIYATVQHFTGINLFGADSPRLIAGLSVEGARYISKGTFSHHQTFANVYLMIFCVAFSIAISSGTVSKRLLFGGLSFLLILALVFSYTRGVWLAFSVSVLTIASLRGRRMFTLIILLLLILGILLVLVPSPYSMRARTIFSIDGNLDRLNIWKISWAIFRDHPILGIGLGNYSTIQRSYLPANLKAPISRAHAHNIYLQIAVERGLFALVIYMWIWYLLLRIAFSSLRFLRSREGFRVAAIRGATAGVIGFLIDGFFQNNFGDTEVAIVLFFFMAVIVALRIKQTEREEAASIMGGSNAPA